MPKSYAWALGFFFLCYVVAIAILFRKDIVHIATGKIQRDVELKAHRELIQSLREDDRHLSAFITDGCSGGLSKAWLTVSDRFPAFAKAHEKPLRGSLVASPTIGHTIRRGGATEAHESYVLRLSADQALRKCVLETGNRSSAYLSTKYGLSEDQIHAAYEVIANAIWYAVRIGGLPCSGLKWRWGYGYAQCPRTTAPR